MKATTFFPFLLRSLACVLLACLPLACQQAAAPAETAPPAPVKWMEARQFFIEEWTEVLGTTQPLPDRAARVSAVVEGHVASVLTDASGKPVVEGQLVKKGDVLVQLDARIAQANRDKVAADQDDLRQQVTQAELGVKLAQIEVRRLRELDKKSTADSPLVAAVQVEKAELAVEDARSRQRGAELRLKAGEKQLKALDEQLHFYTLTAPIAGRLGRLLVMTGQTLAVGAPVAEVIDLEDQIDLLCFVPPSIARRFKAGQVVRLGALEEPLPWPAAKPETKGATESGVKKPAGTEGRIVYIAEQAELDTGNFAVKARFPNARLGLRGNVTVRARVLTTPGRACLTLPEAALQEDQDPPAVIVVEDYKQETKDNKEVETGKARKLRVKVGMRDRVLRLVEILGLEDPEKKWQGTLDTAKFVVERGQGLRTGDPIRLEVEDEDEAAAPEVKKD